MLSTALSLFFAEATFTFTVSADDLLSGTIDWNGGGLDLKGTIQPAGAGSPLTVQIVGLGRPGTQTDNWEYDYFGYLAHSWPNGVGQVPVLVGSVLKQSRTTAHLRDMLLHSLPSNSEPAPQIQQAAIAMLTGHF